MQITLIGIIRIVQAYRHIEGKCPGDGNDVANEVGIVEVRALWDNEWICVVDSAAHDFAELCRYA